MAWQDREYYRDESSSFGGFGSRLRGASVVQWLLGINCVVFLLDAVLSSGSRTPWWMSPSILGEFSIQSAIYRVQLWRFVTYQFLHFGLFHVAVNMIGLFFFGPMIERWWGSRRFLAFYLLCGTCGAVIFSLIGILAPEVIYPADAPGEVTTAPLVGASGSLFGILVACAVLYPQQRVMLLIPPIPMSMRTMALFFLGLAALAVIVGADNAGGQAAHLGGALLGFVLVKNPRRLDWADRLSPSAIQSGVNQGRFERRQRQQRQQQAEVDRILDKVSQHGLQSLTRKEKKTLSRATEQKRRAG